MSNKRQIPENDFNSLLQKYQKAVEKLKQLEQEVHSLRASSNASEEISHYIEGIDAMVIRISSSGKIDYINRNFSKFFNVEKHDILGRDAGILYQLRNQSLIDKILQKPFKGTRIVEAMDEIGEHYKIKMTSNKGVLDVVMENITDHHKFRDYVKKYISVDLAQLSEDDLTTFKFPERRFITVSFTNLKEFTSLSETLLPAQLRKTLNTYLESSIQAIERNMATVDKIMGDEIMALYGAPKYYRDHAMRALISASDQMTGMQKVRAKLAGNGIKVRGCGIGINTGDMVVGSIGSNTRKDYTVMGSSVNIAAKLSKIAQEGEILLTESTMNAALNALPKGWEAVEQDLQQERARDSRYEMAKQITPLQNKTGKKIFIGPRNKPNYVFQYMFSLRMKGVRTPLTIIRASLVNAAGAEIESENDYKPNGSERLFGKFRLVKRLGKGGMGEVWLGRDDYGNELAIKTLLAKEHASESQIRRFMHEAEVMTKLHHRGICRIHEVGEIDHINYIAMEFIRGVSLGQLLEYSPERENTSPGSDSRLQQTEVGRLAGEFIDPRQPLAAKVTLDYPNQKRQGQIFKEEKIVELIRCICSAIQFAHEHHVFHRDIKPQNILVRPNGEPVIMDFSIARIPTQTDVKKKTGKGRIFGTIEYMSPEQAFSSETSDARSDIYAVGAIMYLMATGRKHFISSKNIIQDIKRLRHHHATRPSIFNRRISADMEAIILKALSNSPEKRYASAWELDDDLRKLQSGEVISARRGMLIYRLGKKLNKKKKGASLILAAILIVSVFLGYIVREQRKQWGNWVLVYQSAFDTPEPGKPHIRFRDELNRHPVQPFTLNPNGMKMQPHQWCWLDKAREMNLWGDIRVVVNFRYKSHPNALYLCINAKDTLIRARDRVPPGYAVLHAAGMGTLNIISKVEENQHLNISNFTACKNARGKNTQVTFQQINNRLAYFINGRLKLSMQDVLPQRERRFQSIGLMSLADSLYLQSIRVYRLSLPEKASPLIAGEVLLSRGKLQEALDEYLTISEDYFGTEVAEQALVEAYAIAFEHKEKFNRLIAPIKSDFTAHYKDSRFTNRFLEIETLIYWKEKKFQKALNNLDKLLTASPGSPILFQLDNRDLPPVMGKRFLDLVNRDGNIRSFNLTPGSGLGLSDLQGIDLNLLMAANKGLKSLSPLASFNLKWLWIPDNEVTGLEPLAGLPLNFLNGDFNRISVLSPLVNSRLKYLSLKGNRITEVASIGAQPTQELDLSMNRLENAEGIRAMPLVKLNLARNKLKMLPWLVHRKLTDINVSENQLKSLGPLLGQPITTIDFSSNLVKDISVLSDMPIQYIYADNNLLRDISPLKEKKIRLLSLTGNSLENYQSLNSISVTSLCLRQNGLENLPTLYSLIMEKLDISYNRLTSLEPLVHLSLSQLNCANNNIASLEPLKGMKLNRLDCRNNQLTSLYPLYHNPPDTFYFNSYAIPDFDIKKAVNIWSKNKRYQFNLHYAECVLAMRRNDIGKLKSLGKSFRGHHYLHMTAPVSWQQASVLCRKLGGHLVTLADEAESDFMSQVLRNNRHVWMGIKSEDDRWTWVTGEPFIFNNALNPNSAKNYPTLLLGGNYNGKTWVPPEGIHETGFIVEWED